MRGASFDPGKTYHPAPLCYFPCAELALRHPPLHYRSAQFAANGGCRMNEMPDRFPQAEAQSAMPRQHPAVRHGRIGVLLLNLGTPDATGYWPMRRYLKEFLSDAPRHRGQPRWSGGSLLNLDRAYDAAPPNGARRISLSGTRSAT